MTLLNTETNWKKAKQLCKEMMQPNFNFEDFEGLEKIYETNNAKRIVYKWGKLIFKTNQNRVEYKINNLIKGVSCHPNFYNLNKNIVVMDYVEGNPLSEQIYLQPNQTSKIVMAIKELQNLNILCQDLHEKNIVIDTEGNPMIIDTDCYEDMNGWTEEEKKEAVTDEIDYVENYLDIRRKERLRKYEN